VSGLFNHTAKKWIFFKDAVLFTKELVNMMYEKFQTVVATAIILLLNTAAVYMVAAHPPVGIFGF
jgi:hypothetical protein